MFSDLSGLPVSGGVIAGVVIYAGVSVFATGPLIGERTIEKSGWDARCKTAIVREVNADRSSSAPPIPDLDCGSVFGTLFGEQGQRFCSRHGGSFRLPFIDQLQEQQRRVSDLNEQRYAIAAENAGSRCACAAAITLEERRVPLAIHAGSLRLITPPSVKTLTGDVEAALRQPQCAMRG